MLQSLTLILKAIACFTHALSNGQPGRAQEAKNLIWVLRAEKPETRTWKRASWQKESNEPIIKLIPCNMTKGDRVRINHDSSQNISYQLESHKVNSCEVPNEYANINTGEWINCLFRKQHFPVCENANKHKATTSCWEVLYSHTDLYIWLQFHSIFLMRYVKMHFSPFQSIAITFS